jgi:hypothetical protein
LMWTSLVLGGFTVALLGIAVALINVTPQAAGQQSATAAPLRHVVLFKFKDEATKEQVQEIVTAFQGLPSKIDGITAFEFGTNNSPEGLADGFTHCFVVTFKDTKARDAYLPHQAHKDFVAILRPRLDKVLVVDYFAQK